MKQFLVPVVAFLALGTNALAAELTPDNLIGRYKVEGRAGLQKIYANFRVINGTEFELQRVYQDGRKDELCDGTFTLNKSLTWDETLTFLTAGKTFKGNFTCPSNRSRTVTFNIDFANKTTEDLERGTSVIVTSSMAPGMRVNAYVKKQ